MAASLQIYLKTSLDVFIGLARFVYYYCYAVSCTVAVVYLATSVTDNR